MRSFVQMEDRRLLFMGLISVSAKTLLYTFVIKPYCPPFVFYLASKILAVNHQQTY